MRLSTHFTLEEFTVSQTAARLGLDNTPAADILPSISRTAQGLERIRDLTGFPIIITSGFRSYEVNKAVGGSFGSQHLIGEAADIICPRYGSPLKLARLIERHITELMVDQVILEFGRWVHVSFSLRPRYMALTIRSSAEGYHAGIFA